MADYRSNKIIKGVSLKTTQKCAGIGLGVLTFGLGCFGNSLAEDKNSKTEDVLTDTLNVKVENDVRKFGLPKYASEYIEDYINDDPASYTVYTIKDMSVILIDKKNDSTHLIPLNEAQRLKELVEIKYEINTEDLIQVKEESINRLFKHYMKKHKKKELELWTITDDIEADNQNGYAKASLFPLFISKEKNVLVFEHPDNGKISEGQKEANRGYYVTVIDKEQIPKKSYDPAEDSDINQNRMLRGIVDDVLKNVLKHEND
ncbi:MAG: hypothetical protein PVG39_22660 [Desulfobacteraceae bacterium]|jgi:hypothetical protein